MALANYVVLGTLLGQQRAATALAVQATINIVNMGAAFAFVYGFGWGIGGLAAATALADAVGLLFGAAILWQGRPSGLPRLRLAELWERAALVRLILVNRDVFLRTLCLLACFAWFAHAGARQGDTILAANALLLNFQTFMAYVLDAFAQAAEALVGAAIGARDRGAYRAAVIVSAIWAVASAALFALVYAALGPTLIRALTDHSAIRSAALLYLPWAAVSPIVSVWSFQLDGILHRRDAHPRSQEQHGHRDGLLHGRGVRAAAAVGQPRSVGGFDDPDGGARRDPRPAPAADRTHDVRAAGLGAPDLHVRLGEIVALEQERGVERFRERVGNTIAEVECGGVKAFAEAVIRSAAVVSVLAIVGDHLDLGSCYQLVQSDDRVWAGTPQQDRARLEQGERR